MTNLNQNLNEQFLNNLTLCTKDSQFPRQQVWKLYGNNAMKIILTQQIPTELILIYQYFIFCKNRFNYVIINTIDSND